MAARLNAAFNTCAEEGRTAAIFFITAGFPTRKDTVPIMLAMQEAGIDIIELGVPFSDPVADGPTIQYSNQVALEGGTNSYGDCIELVGEARRQGLTVPVVLMGYYNPVVAYGEAKLVADCAAVEVDGFIVVDLPPEESLTFRSHCRDNGLSFVPLITPVSSDSRLASLCKCASSWIYCVSVAGVTGERANVSQGLGELVGRIKKHSDLPVAIGFGITNKEQFQEVGRIGEGVVIGSALVKAITNAANEGGDVVKAVKDFCAQVVPRDAPRKEKSPAHQLDKNTPFYDKENVSSFRFGAFGGRYVPETLVGALDELDQQYEAAKNDPEFLAEFESYYKYMGRPSSLHVAPHMTKACGGARIWLKREDLNHTGSHKINNAVGQALLAKRLGKTRIICETGAGQHGVATATVCAMMGLDLTVYMGAEDASRQQLNVFRMELLGAKVVPVHAGAKTLKDAINEALRDWVSNIATTHYLIGSAIGPYPFPTIVRDFQSVIGKETREEMLEQTGKLPDYVIACVGGGSNAIGMFYPFIEDKEVNMIGVEAAGQGIETGEHSASLSAGRPGVLHGTKTYLLQDQQGQITPTHSISAGLDYPGVGPEHAYLKDSGRATYTSVTDKQALEAFLHLSQLEGIIPALESSHAVYEAMRLAKTLPKEKDIVVCLSGRGDKDVRQVRTALPRFGLDPRQPPSIP